MQTITHEADGLFLPADICITSDRLREHEFTAWLRVHSASPMTPITWESVYKVQVSATSFVRVVATAMLVNGVVSVVDHIRYVNADEECENVQQRVEKFMSLLADVAKRKGLLS